jgi:hypothetical protein
MAVPDEPDFAAILARVARALTGGQIPFMVIGGQAVLVHGEPRLTQDIDLTVGISIHRLADVLAACDEASLSSLPDDVERFVHETFVLPVADRATGTRVDLIFSETPYEAAAIQRADVIEVAGAAVPFATAEDLLLHKLFAGRPRDIEDAEGIVRRKGGDIDWSYVSTWAEAFSEVPGREEMPAQVARLRRRRRGVRPGA